MSFRIVLVPSKKAVKLHHRYETRKAERAHAQQHFVAAQGLRMQADVLQSMLDSGADIPYFQAEAMEQQIMELKAAAIENENCKCTDIVNNKV